MQDRQSSSPPEQPTRRPTRSALGWALLGIGALASWGLWLWWGRAWLGDLWHLKDAPVLGTAAVGASAASFGRAIVLWRSAATTEKP